MIGISVAISKKIKNKTDFFVAGRNLPLWLCTATLTATWFGGGATSYGKSSSSSKSLTVIITFDDNKTVLDFTYQSLKF